MLHADRIRAIERDLAESPLSYTQLAEKYDVCKRTIQKIASGEVTADSRDHGEQRDPPRFSIPLEGAVGGSILERSGTDYSIPPQCRGQRLGH